MLLRDTDKTERAGTRNPGSFRAYVVPLLTRWRPSRGEAITANHEGDVYSRRRAVGTLERRGALAWPVAGRGCDHRPRGGREGTRHVGKGKTFPSLRG